MYVWHLLTIVFHRRELFIFGCSTRFRGKLGLNFLGMPLIVVKSILAVGSNNKECEGVIEVAILQCYKLFIWAIICLQKKGPEGRLMKNGRQLTRNLPQENCDGSVPSCWQ